MKTIIKHTIKCPLRTQNAIILNNVIPSAIIHIDETKNAFELFVDIMKRYLGHDVLLIEDDAKLCLGFCDKSIAIISHYPNDVIQFMDLKKTNHVTSFLPGYTYCMNVCSYIPKSIVYQLANRVEEYQRLNKHPTSTDMYLRWVLQQNRLKYLSVRPNLAQHLPFSSVQHKGASRSRQSLYFIDDAKESI